MTAQKAGGLVLVAFLLFFVITQPQSSADVLLTVLGFLRDAAESVIVFLQSMF